MKDMIKGLINIYDQLSDPDEEAQEIEILYGWAGYLMCLHLILKDVDTENKTIKELVERVVRGIVDDGKNFAKSESRILVRWPRRKSEGGKYYLGGAHGLAGVLYMLLISV